MQTELTDIRMSEGQIVCPGINEAAFTGRRLPAPYFLFRTFVRINFIVNMNYTNKQVFMLVALRVVIGWHFLFEGAVKIFNGGWSSKAFLLDSKGFLAGFFHWMAGNNAVLAAVDFLNIWGLTLIGLALILGILTRISIIAGIVLLCFYYLSHPAFLGLEYVFPSEGTYFIVNKSIVEIAALLVLYFFPTSRIVGLERIFCKKSI